MEDHTADLLLDQCARYPGLALQDLLKALYQSVFGCGHFVTDREAGLRLLREELGRPGPETAAVEELDGPFCRVHLRPLAGTGLSAETLFRLFQLSAEGPAGDAAELEEKLSRLLELARSGRIPFREGEVSGALARWRAAGHPPCRHSERFRARYVPAYRVLRRDFARALPLLAAIDGRRGERWIVALEGGSASGKTTLAALLARIYDCGVFHMDDFFLRPGQRTRERLAEPGGNVDRERFLEEVLEPLRRGETVRLRRYDCHTQTLGEAVEVPPRALSIVEGAYSMHPALAERYDLTVFLRVSPEVQRERILRREGEAGGARFFSRWIPLEEAYFAATDPAARCDIVLEG